MSTSTSTPRWRTFASFAVRNYRYFFIGALISNLGTWIQRIGQDWLVLTELTDGSAAALGVVTALQFLAVPFLAPYAGAIVDRYSKRTVLLITQVLLAVTAFALFGLVALGVIELWHVYLLAFIQGAITAFDNPARQAFVTEIVEPKLVSNAVGLNSMSFNGARLIGPGVAGLMIAAVGVSPTLLINAITFIPMIFAIKLMNASELTPAKPIAKKGAIRDGMRYIAGRPDIIILLVIVFMMGTFGMKFQIFNATMATEAFGKGAGEFGLLGTIMAIGTFAGALIAARRAKPSFRTLMLSLAAFAVSTTLLAFAPNYTIYALLLIPSGFFALTVLTSANAAVQLATAPEYRGRVMAVYMAIFLGGSPIGAPLLGWLGDLLGPRASVVFGSLPVGLTVIGVLIYLMLHDGVRFRLQRGWPFRIQVLTPKRRDHVKAA